MPITVVEFHLIEGVDGAIGGDEFTFEIPAETERVSIGAAGGNVSPGLLMPYADLNPGDVLTGTLGGSKTIFSTDPHVGGAHGGGDGVETQIVEGVEVGSTGGGGSTEIFSAEKGRIAVAGGGGGSSRATGPEMLLAPWPETYHAEWWDGPGIPAGTEDPRKPHSGTLNNESSSFDGWIIFSEGGVGSPRTGAAGYHNVVDGDAGQALTSGGGGGGWGGGASCGILVPPPFSEIPDYLAIEAEGRTGGFLIPPPDPSLIPSPGDAIDYVGGSGGSVARVDIVCAWGFIHDAPKGWHVGTIRFN